MDGKSNLEKVAPLYHKVFNNSMECTIFVADWYALWTEVLAGAKLAKVFNSL